MTKGDSPAEQRSHVALVRGINIGPSKRVAMADLRAVFEDLGFESVATLLNSGNAVFRAGRRKVDPPAIESALERRTGVRARVLILSAAALETIIDEDPLGRGATNPSKYFVNFPLDPGFLRDLDALPSSTPSGEDLVVTSRAAYLWCPEGLSKGALAAQLMKIARDRATTRNWATVQKIHALLA